MITSLSSCTILQHTNYPYQTAIHSIGTTSGAGDIRSFVDTVNISKEGKSASILDGLWDTIGIAPNSDGNISIESIRECYENDTAIIKKQMQALYRKLGISSDTEMTIDIGHDGKAVVSGKSPEAEALADAINSDPELLNTMRRASANASLLAAFEEAAEFQAAYEKNPFAAVERYGYLLNDNRTQNTAFTIREGSLHVDVEIGHSLSFSVI